MKRIIVYATVTREGVTYALSPETRTRFPKGRPRVFLGLYPASLKNDRSKWPTIVEILTGEKFKDLFDRVVVQTYSGDEKYEVRCHE